MNVHIPSTNHACVDYARTTSKLSSLQLETSEFKDFIIKSIIDGSRAEAEATSCYVQTILNFKVNHEWIANILKVLPTAVARRNVQPLAALCTTLAIQVGTDAAITPLISFAYIDHQSRHIAIQTVFKILESYVEQNSQHLSTSLNQLRVFWKKVLSDDTTGSSFYLIVRSIRALATNLKHSEKKFIANFLLDLDHNYQQTVTSSETVPDSSFKDETFLLSEVSYVSSDREIWRRVIVRSICDLFENGSVEHFDRLLALSSNEIQKVTRELDINIFIYLIILQVAFTACSGNFHDSCTTLKNVQVLLQLAQVSNQSLRQPVYELTSAVCVSVASICPPGVASYLTAEAAKTLQLAKACKRVVSSNTGQNEFASTLDTFFAEVVPLRYSKTALALGLISKFDETWSETGELVKWFEIDVYNAASTCPWIESTTEDPTDLTTWISGDANDEVLDRNGASPEDPDKLMLDIVLGSISMAGTAHQSSRVRLASLKPLTALGSRVLLFQLPALLNYLQREEHGAVACYLFKSVLTSEQLITDVAARNIILSLLLQLSHRRHDPKGNPIAEASFSAIAHAVTYCPGIASAILQSEVKSVLKLPSEQSVPNLSAVAGAVHHLIYIRPARGAAFIPFISRCIQKENLKKAPQASSLAFAAMEIMTDEEVLDPVKAVRVVFKTASDPLAVPVGARGTYLRLLGSVSTGSTTKKGRILAEKIVNVLRNCIISACPRADKKSGQSASQSLSWSDIDEAAASLSRYSVDEITGLAFEDNEQVTDISAEKERKEQLAQMKAQLVLQFVSTIAEASNQGETVKQLWYLIMKVVDHEWKNRARLNYDPERIAKLKTKTEALKRARLAQRRDTKDLEATDNAQAFQNFTSAASVLPAGVVKSLCIQCTFVQIEEGLKSSATNASISLRLLAESGALPSGLPWASFLREAYNKSNNSHEKAACISVLRTCHESNPEFESVRDKWFSPRSPILTACCNDPIQMKELFLGIATQSSVSDIRNLIDVEYPFPEDVMKELTSAVAELKGDDASLQKAARYLYGQIAIQSYKWKTSTLSALELLFRENCLRFCSSSVLESFIEEGIVNESGVRLLCKLGHRNILRKLCNIIGVGELERFGTHTSKSALAIVETIGHALCGENRNVRQEFLLDLCTNVGGNQVAHSKAQLARCYLGAHLLGVSAVLPNVEAALLSAETVFQPDSPEVIRRACESLLAMR